MRASPAGNQSRQGANTEGGAGEENGFRTDDYPHCANTLLPEGKPKIREIAAMFEKRGLADFLAGLEQADREQWPITRVAGGVA